MPAGSPTTPISRRRRTAPARPTSPIPLPVAARFTGGNGNDTLLGGLGVDTLTGAAGNDTVSYVGDSDALFISLATGTTQRGSAAAAVEDVLVTIENVIGGTGSDSITGSTGNNVLDGGAGIGNDTASTAVRVATLSSVGMAMISCWVASVPTRSMAEPATMRSSAALAMIRYLVATAMTALATLSVMASMSSTAGLEPTASMSPARPLITP